jgi:hypothetical protein
MRPRRFLANTSRPIPDTGCSPAQSPLEALALQGLETRLLGAGFATVFVDFPSLSRQPAVWHPACIAES